MLIVGEKINSSNKSVGQAITDRDEAFIQRLAVRQVEAGAAMLDLNAGVRKDDEPERMEWLVNAVQAAVNVPLAIDSTNAEALERGLALLKQPGVVNSVSGEESRAERILPLVREYAARVVLLAVGKGGMPKSAEDRVKEAARLTEVALEHGVSPEDIYVDPAAMPASLVGEGTVAVLQAIRDVKASLGVKVIVGLSNVSFGLPNRHLLNHTFLAMSLAHGLDAAIMDPTDRQLMATLHAAHALLGKDDYCANYIRAYREGRLA